MSSCDFDVQLRLQRGTPMTISASVAAFIAGQRELLARLEQFAETPEYQRPLAAAGL